MKNKLFLMKNLSKNTRQLHLFIILIITFCPAVNASPYALTTGLLSFSNVKRLGAFRLPDGDTWYARGVIEINPANNSFYLAGHEHRNHIAEFSIPNRISSSSNLNDLATAKLLQDFQGVMQRASDGNHEIIEKVGGLKLVSDSQGKKKLIGAGYEYYDNSGQTYTHFVINNPDNLASTSVHGYYTIKGPGRKQSGYMVELPKKWKQIFGKTHIVGQSSGIAIIGDLSVGPAAYAVNLTELGTESIPDTIRLLEYALKRTLNPRGSRDLQNESRTNNIWTHLSRASGVFISGDTIGFIGRSGGHHHGVAYKNNIINPCAGTGGYGANNCDYDFHYWFYDLNDLKKVMDGKLRPHIVQPYEHGSFQLPWTVNNGASGIGGVATDPRTGYIYLTQLMSDTTKPGSHATRPIIHVFDVGTATPY